MATSTSSRQFKINRSPFSRHYTVLDTNDAPLYHVDQSLFTKDKADLTLHQGTGTDGPIVAVVHMPRLSFNCQIGLGDPTAPANGTDVVWEELARESNATASAHRWSMTLPGSDGGGKKSIMWKRTHKVSADGTSSSAVTMRDLKLVEDGTDRMVAVFTSKYSWSTCGILQINVDYGRDFDVMATATMLALYEKARKRRARASAAGGT